MNLTVRDVASLLGTSEKTIYRWVRDGAVPCYRIRDHYRFNRTEILEWATAKRIRVSPDLLSEPAASTDGPSEASLAAGLEAGGIFYRIEGTDTPSVLKSVVDHMRLPDAVDRAFLLEVLLARETLQSTAIGDGIAIPHVRNPVVLHVDRPTVSLCFLDRPVHFGALDGQPVHCLFAMVSPTARAHLRLLARLSYAIRDAAFHAALETQASREQILIGARRVEAALAEVDPAAQEAG